MAESYSSSAGDARLAARVWVMSVAVAGLLMLGAGLWLARATSGVAQPWIGLGLFMALLLAAVVGASKTSSA